MSDKIGVAFSEASTWRGIIYILMAFGLNIAPELQEAIVSAGLGVAGILGVFFKRKDP